jgi:hypothetical protein
MHFFKGLIRSQRVELPVSIEKNYKKVQDKFDFK